MDALTILVPLFTAILVAFVTYFFTKSHYEKKRLDDLADRESARRTAVYDMRIQEAREALRKFITIISVASAFISSVEDENDLESVIKSFPYSKDEIEKFPVLVIDALNDKSSIDLLKDKKLSGMMKKLFGLLRPTFEQIFIQFSVIDSKFDEVKKDIKEIDKRIQSDGFTRDEVNEIEEMVSNLAIKSRIDITDFRNSIDIHKFQADMGKARKVITEMNARLDELASALK